MFDEALLLDFGGVVCEFTKDLSSKQTLVSSIFPTLLRFRVIHFPSVVASTLELLGTVVVLSGSPVAAVETWPPISNDVSPIGYFRVEGSIARCAVGCLACAVTVLTGLTQSSPSVPMLPIRPSSTFLSANTRRLIASWMSNVLLERQDIQSQWELGFGHLLYAVGLDRVHTLWDHLLHSSHYIPSSTANKQYGCPHL
ncbi:hypothetical protein MS3_00001274 [Schistosoma haematobium]|uniref:Uncharacterized protein n=1 Tax=Schistosoma haematobium TaxID=6185 RepID=A0A922LSQ4_SCHHA|nr:hypothetical protein MS3_00001274 [Schistosoma haematobium]KAH9592577.1 hypothetical protein MS3_00001274 [Schistosoma haematobium]